MSGKRIRAVLVYQAGIANVFSVDNFLAEPLEGGKRRGAVRLAQHAFSYCEAFAHGLRAAGVEVRVACCNAAGDIREATWSSDLPEAPFAESRT